MTAQMLNLQDGLLGPKVVLAGIQLESPFHGELKESRLHGENFFSWTPEAILRRKGKIISIINKILEENPKIKIVVLPEYSIPFEILGDLKEYSTNKEIIIIGGSYIDDPDDNDFRKNIGVIFIPKEEVIFLVKEHLSTYERDYVRGNKEGYLELFYKANGKEIFIQIFMCLDLIYSRGCPTITKQPTDNISCTDIKSSSSSQHPFTL